MLTKTVLHWNRNYFNSRPHGGRPDSATVRSAFVHFNSRPHGGRRDAGRTVFCRSNFNSRPHGGRLLPSEALPPSAVFQLTPSRRATMLSIARHLVSSISTHALTEGDRTAPPNETKTAQFQLTPSRRATYPRVSTVYRISQFQLTPSRRATAGTI